MSTDADFVRTTISVRADLFQRARREGKSLSEVVNDALEARFGKPRDLFGRFPQVSVDDLRDHEDRD